MPDDVHPRHGRSACGLNQIAIPERVDFTRKIGGDRQATLRVNLASIMNRARFMIEARFTRSVA